MSLNRDCTVLRLTANGPILLFILYKNFQFGKRPRCFFSFWITKNNLAMSETNEQIIHSYLVFGYQQNWHWFGSTPHKLRFEMKSTTQWVGYFETISGHLFGNYINISHKTEVLVVFLMCLTYSNLYLIKKYDIKHNFCHLCFFSIL